MATKRRKKDGRASNGRKPTGLTERSVLVEMPKNLLDGVDACAQRLGVKRSEWIREALRASVEQQVIKEVMRKHGV